MLIDKIKRSLPVDYAAQCKEVARIERKTLDLSKELAKVTGDKFAMERQIRELIEEIELYQKERLELLARLPRS